MRKFSKISLNIIYTIVVLVVLAVALLFVGTKVSVLGYEVKIVQSGSMEPAVRTGGIVVISPSKAYNVGDIVTYGRNTRSQTPVTHRIVEKTGEGSRAIYRTKGDANEDIDPRTVAGRNILGKVDFTIPYIGYVIQFARTPLGFLLLIGIPAALIVLDELASIVWEIRKYRAMLWYTEKRAKGKKADINMQRQPRTQVTGRPRRYYLAVKRKQRYI